MRQLLHTYHGSGRGPQRQIPAEHFHERPDVVDVDQEDIHLDQGVSSETEVLESRLGIFEGLSSLFRYAARHQLAGVGPGAGFACKEDDVFDTAGPRVWPPRIVVEFLWGDFALHSRDGNRIQNTILCGWPSGCAIYSSG